MEFKEAARIASQLKGRKVIDAKAGTSRAAYPEEIEAAAMIDSLIFQLKARIGVAKAEAAEQTGAK